MVKLLLLFCLVGFEPFEIDEQIISTPELLERIQRLEENPININRATKQELMLIPYIDNLLSESIIDYREEKPFTNISELLLIERITPLLLDRIRPYITVEIKRPKVAILRGVKLLSRFERNVDDSQNKVYNRLEIPYKGVSISGVLEKDYEEDDYFDYYAGSIYSPGNFVIGDYDLDIGMGLIFSKPDFFYAGSGIIPGERGFSPHLSTYEENYQRGAALEWRNVTLFGSFIETSDYGEEKLIGASYKFHPFRITGAVGDYGIEDMSRATLLSLYMDKDLAGNLMRFEIATGGSVLQDMRENIAYSLGIDNGKGLKAIYASIPANIPTLRNSPFNKNEEALYLHFEKKIIPSVSTALYSELTRENSPLSEFERLIGFQMQWNPLKGLSLYGRLKTTEERDGLRLDLTYRKYNLNIRNRFEVVNTDGGSGFLAYTGIRYSADYILETRFIFYETNNWDSRIYEYENGLPGTFTIKQLSGSGRRIYLILAEKVLPLKGYLKWGMDFKDGVHHNIGLAVVL